MNYERDMYIDVTALDVEWTEQAELAMKYGGLWSAAQEVSSRAEENVKLVHSELYLKVTANPEDLLGATVKSTEGTKTAWIQTQEEYKNAKSDAIDAMKRLNDIAIAKNEIAFTRKAALENLVTLHGQQYFAGPKMPRDLQMEVGKRREAREFAKGKSNRKVRMRRND